MTKLEKLSAELTSIQENVLGIYLCCGTIEHVVSKSDEGFTTLHIGQMLGIQWSYYGKDKLKDIIYFDNGHKTLKDATQDPFEFASWCTKNKIYEKSKFRVVSV